MPEKRPLQTPPAVSNGSTNAGAADPSEVGDAPTPLAHVPTVPGPAAVTRPSSVGRFVVESELGRGGMGIIWKAHDPELKRPVAIKVLRRRGAEAERRFVEEAQVTGQLQHPAIPSVHDIGRLPDGSPYLAMKLIEGQTLSRLLRERPNPAHDLPRFLAIFARVCQAVAYAHSRGVVHRDLKPSNIMVGAFGEVLVMDWGLAKVLASGTGQAPTAAQVQTVRSQGGQDESEAGDLIGTPGYMAPEQARGEVMRLDERADVFGLGAILCEILTGKPPFVGADTSIIVQHAADADLADALARLDRCGVDAEVISLAKACLSASRDRRPRRGEDVARAVDAYLEGVQERLRQAEVARARAEVRSAEERKRRLLAVSLAGAVVLLVAVGGGAAWWNERQRAELQRLSDEEDAAARARQERLRQSLETLPGRVEELKRTGFWDEARVALEDVQLHAQEDGTDEQRRKLKDALVHLEQLRRLDAVRQDSALVVDGRLNSATAPARYEKVFTDMGLDVQGGDLAALTRRVLESPIREGILDALDDWACSEAVDARRERLWRLSAAVTGEGWRERLADAKVWKSAAALQRLLTPDVLDRLRPPTQEGLGMHLEAIGGDGLAVLENGCRRHPADFWLLFGTGNVFRERRQQPDAAIGYYRAALVVQPRNAAVYLNLGVALHSKKDLDGAIAATRRAIEIDPKIPLAHSNLGNALREKGEFAGAVAACRQAIRLDARCAQAHTNLGLALRDSKDLDGAVAACREAVAVDPAMVLGYTNLAAVLIQKGEWREGTEIVERGLKVAPRDGGLNSLLAIARLMQGRFAEARTIGRQALDLLPAGHAMKENLPLIIQEAELMIAVEKRLPDVLSGKEKVQEPADLLNLARLCHQYRAQHATAVRFYADAFAADPSAAGNLVKGRRLEAACSAVLAADGQGKDAGSLDDKERARLRRQALDWLRADLAAWSQLAGNRTLHATIREKLSGWQTRADLASVRDAAALAKLPQVERTDWQQFWVNVAELLRRTAGSAEKS